MSTSSTRRSFCLLLSCAALAALTSASTAQAAGDLKFELYADKAAEFRWRLKAGNGATLATAGQGYKDKADAKSAIERIKSEAATLDSETYEDAKHEFRWRLKARNGQIIAASSEGYKARGAADHALTLVKEGAKDATVVDGTPAR